MVAIDSYSQPKPSLQQRLTVRLHGSSAQPDGLPVSLETQMPILMGAGLGSFGHDTSNH